MRIDLDFVSFDLGVQRGDFGSEQTRCRPLTPTRLNKRTANQLPLEPAHLGVQVDRVTTLAVFHLLDGRDFAQQRQSEDLQKADLGVKEIRSIDAAGQSAWIAGGPPRKPWRVVPCAVIAEAVLLVALWHVTV